jgi:hypothetical protein
MALTGVGAAVATTSAAAATPTANDGRDIRSSGCPAGKSAAPSWSGVEEIPRVSRRCSAAEVRGLAPYRQDEQSLSLDCISLASATSQCTGRSGWAGSFPQDVIELEEAMDALVLFFR